MSDTSAHAVTACEDGGHVVKVYGQPVTANPVDSVRAALEAAGVEFTGSGAARMHLRRV